MLTKEKLEKLIESQDFNTYRPLDRDAVLNSFLTLLVCQELNALKEEVASLKELLVVKSESKEVKVETRGRKKSDKEE
jgi:hypothetical protein